MAQGSELRAEGPPLVWMLAKVGGLFGEAHPFESQRTEPSGGTTKNIVGKIKSQRAPVREDRAGLPPTIRGGGRRGSLGGRLGSFDGGPKTEPVLDAVAEQLPGPLDVVRLGPKGLTQGDILGPKVAEGRLALLDIYENSADAPAAVADPGIGLPVRASAPSSAAGAGDFDAGAHGRTRPGPGRDQPAGDKLEYPAKSRFSGPCFDAKPE
jgi:hypothetical protein